MSGGGRAAAGPAGVGSNCTAPQLPFTAQQPSCLTHILGSATTVPRQPARRRQRRGGAGGRWRRWARPAAPAGRRLWRQRPVTGSCAKVWLLQVQSCSTETPKVCCGATACAILAGRRRMALATVAASGPGRRELCSVPSAASCCISLLLNHQRARDRAVPADLQCLPHTVGLPGSPLPVLYA